jgi:hypothetical protein
MYGQPGKELIVKKSLPIRILPEHLDLRQLKRQANQKLCQKTPRGIAGGDP